MTTEQKARAYDEALERAKEKYPACYSPALLEYIFPELKEREDKKMKESCKFFLNLQKINSPYSISDIDKCIAWLEKQDEQNPYSGISFKYNSHTWGMCARDGGVDILLDKQFFKHIKKQGEQKYKFIIGDIISNNNVTYRVDNIVKNCVGQDCYFLVNVESEKGGTRYLKLTDSKGKTYNMEEITWLCEQVDAEFEKQGEQKAGDAYCQENCKGFQQTGKCFSDWDCKAKRKAKSIYEVKPKFKVGDWICNDMCDVHIASIENGMYYFDEGDGLSIVFVDEHYHFWTIQDAMDGDVLATSAGAFIYNGNNGGGSCPGSYCGIDTLGNFKVGVEHHWTGKPVFPATKEQRELLFQKMKEAGCMFDFEKKELKKLGQSEVTKTSDQEIGIVEIPFGAKDSELQEATYHIPKGFHAEINDDKVVIKKGEKPTEWSEEDERMLHTIIADFKGFIRDNTSTIESHFNECINWLKSLKKRIGG